MAEACPEKWTLHRRARSHALSAGDAISADPPRMHRSGMVQVQGGAKVKLLLEQIVLMPFLVTMSKEEEVVSPFHQ